MKIGILCAGDTELAPFLDSLKDWNITEKAMLKFYQGTLAGIPAVALFSGVCKVNAAIAAQILIDTFQVDAVINAGTAGGMAEELEIFDTVVTRQAAYHDVAEDILTEFHPWMPSVFFPSDERLLEAAHRAAGSLKSRVYFGTTVTGEQFIDQERREEINGRFSPLSVDMETAAAAHVCLANRIPFLAIRTITDTARHSGTDTFEENCRKASCIARDLTLLVIKELAREPSAKPAQANTPLLVTDRLILRRFEEKDAPALLTLLGDREVNRFLPWFPFETLEQTEEYLKEHYLDFYQKPEGFRYAVCLKEDNRPVGYIHVSQDDSHDFGYGLRKEFWNRGLITEGARAVIEAVRKSGISYLTATHDVKNPASGQVMKKLGMTYRYSYVEQWQPKDISVVFRMYQLNLCGDPEFTYWKYWGKYPDHFVEDIAADSV